jgi:hypothetical protein
MPCVVMCKKNGGKAEVLLLVAPHQCVTLCIQSKHHRAGNQSVNATAKRDQQAQVHRVLGVSISFVERWEWCFQSSQCFICSRK